MRLTASEIPAQASAGVDIETERRRSEDGYESNP